MLNLNWLARMGLLALLILLLAAACRNADPTPAGDPSAPAEVLPAATPSPDARSLDTAPAEGAAGGGSPAAENKPSEFAAETPKEVEVEVVKEVIREVPVERVVERESMPAAAEPSGASGAQGPAGPSSPQGAAGHSGNKGESSGSGPAATPAPQGQSVPASAPTPAAANAGAALPQPALTTFQNYQRSPVVAAGQDPVSTFSLDTDRTSYYLALNWSRAGYPVEPASVRAEEWINAFDYGYARPLRTDEFAITAELFPHPLDDGKHLARLAFQAPDLRDAGKPLNVTLVLDASGSMAEGNRVAIARAAAESIRQSLRRQDRLSIVHFTDTVLHSLTVADSRPDAAAAQDSIANLQPHGATNVQAGLNLGVQLADQMRQERPDAYNYVILMSDGVANVDATSPFAILESAADGGRDNPLRLITLGVGIANYNDYLLEQLAQHGNGWYRYLDDPAQAQALFRRDNWLELALPFADQTRAQVTWNPDLALTWRLIGYENRVTADHLFEQNRQEFAEIPSGAATTVFYELELRGYPADYTDALGTVELRWVDPDSGQSRQQASAVPGRVNSGIGYPQDPLLQFGALVALAADRYSGLPYINGPDYANAGGQLATLEEQLHLLADALGQRQSYQDFAFLLTQLRQSLPAYWPGDSGYSR